MILVEIRCGAKGCGKLLAELVSEDGALRLRVHQRTEPFMRWHTEIIEAGGHLRSTPG